MDGAGRSGKAQAGEAGKETEPKVETMYFQWEESRREGHDLNEKGGGQEAVRIENKLEERNPEPGSLQWNEGRGEEDLCLWERPDGAQAGGQRQAASQPPRQS